MSHRVKGAANKRWARAAALLPTVTLVAALLGAVCSGGDNIEPEEGTEAPAAPQIDAPFGDLTPDATRALGVPGLSVYSVGGDLQLEQDGDLRKLVVAPELNITYLSPRISPDGRQVVYARFTTGANVTSDIHITNLNGESRIVRQPSGEAEFFWTPQWSPDGASLVYAHQRNKTDAEGRAFQIDVERIELANGQFEILVENAQEPALSPNGRLLVFVDDPAIDQKLSVLDLETGEQTLLLDESDGLAVFRLPQFSPDGEWIAVLASGDGQTLSSAPDLPAFARSNGVQDIWLIRPDGNGLRRLTNLREDQPDIAWSSDGRHILLRGTFGVYIAEVETRTTQTILVPGEFHGTHDWRGALPIEAAVEP